MLVLFIVMIGLLLRTTMKRSRSEDRAVRQSGGIDYPIMKKLEKSNNIIKHLFDDMRRQTDELIASSFGSDVWTNEELKPFSVFHDGREYQISPHVIEPTQASELKRIYSEKGPLDDITNWLNNTFDDAFGSIDENNIMTGFRSSSMYVNGESRNCYVLDIKNNHGQIWRIEGTMENNDSPYTRIHVGMRNEDNDMWRYVGKYES